MYLGLTNQNIENKNMKIKCLNENFYEIKNNETLDFSPLIAVKK